MGDYKHDMSGEKRPPSLLPEGARLVRVNEMIYGTSKNGNEMYTVTIEDIKTHKSMQCWLVATKGKRWLLKSLLSSMGLQAAQDGVYDWSVTDVLGKTVTAVIEHVSEPWINREGKTVDSIKAKVVEFLVPEKDEAEALWNEESK